MQIDITQLKYMKRNGEEKKIDKRKISMNHKQQLHKFNLPF